MLLQIPEMHPGKSYQKWPTLMQSLNKLMDDSDTGWGWEGWERWERVAEWLHWSSCLCEPVLFTPYNLIFCFGVHFKLLDIMNLSQLMSDVFKQSVFILFSFLFFFSVVSACGSCSSRDGKYAGNKQRRKYPLTSRDCLTGLWCSKMNPNWHSELIVDIILPISVIWAVWKITVIFEGEK